MRTGREGWGGGKWEGGEREEGEGGEGEGGREGWRGRGEWAPQNF